MYFSREFVPEEYWDGWFAGCGGFGGHGCCGFGKMFVSFVPILMAALFIYRFT